MTTAWVNYIEVLVKNSLTALPNHIMGNGRGLSFKGIEPQMLMNVLGYPLDGGYVDDMLTPSNSYVVCKGNDDMRLVFMWDTNGYHGTKNGDKLLLSSLNTLGFRDIDIFFLITESKIRMMVYRDNTLQDVEGGTLDLNWIKYTNEGFKFAFRGKHKYYSFINVAHYEVARINMWKEKKKVLLQRLQKGVSTGDVGSTSIITSVLRGVLSGDIPTPLTSIMIDKGIQVVLNNQSGKDMFIEVLYYYLKHNFIDVARNTHYHKKLAMGVGAVLTSSEVAKLVESVNKN